MAKEITKQIKLQIPAGKATPAPPVGTVLGPAGINLQEFCTKFNDATRDKMGDIIPVEISLYEDRTYFYFLSKRKNIPSACLFLSHHIFLIFRGKGSLFVPLFYVEKTTQLAQ